MLKACLAEGGDDQTVFWGSLWGGVGEGWLVRVTSESGSRLIFVWFLKDFERDPAKFSVADLFCQILPYLGNYRQ